MEQEAPQQRQQQRSTAAVHASEDAAQCVQQRTAEQVIDVPDDAGEPERKLRNELVSKLSKRLPRRLLSERQTETSLMMLWFRPRRPCAQVFGRTSGSPKRWPSTLTRPAVTYATLCAVVEYTTPVSAENTATAPVDENVTAVPLICRRGRRSRIVVAGSYERGLPICSTPVELFGHGHQHQQ